MSTPQYPKVFPESGQRELTPQEQLQRKRALDCALGEEPLSCQGQVWVSIFFDGTNNNKDDKKTGEPVNGHSNVARLHGAHRDDPQKGIFRFYIPGVGTPFPEIGDSGGVIVGALGGGLGFLGADRINWGILQVVNAVHNTLFPDVDLINDQQAKTIVSNMSSMVSTLGFEGSYRRMVLNTWEEKLTAVVKKHPMKLTQINVAVFGFSRGAASARAFVNWLFQICEREGGGFALAGVPLRVYFLGIMDTVGSVGTNDSIPGLDGHMAWASTENLAINQNVEQCVHFVALHEQRGSFPLDSANGRAREVIYPGMHSDVGGGYAPGEQGKNMPIDAPSPHLSQIPLLDMFHEATKAGVPLMSWEDIQKRNKLKKDFSVSPTLIKNYNGYLAAHKVPSLPLHQAVRKHMTLYFRWRGQHLAPGALESQAFYLRASTADQKDMKKTHDELCKQVEMIPKREAANRTSSGYLKERSKDFIRIASIHSRAVVEEGLEPVTPVEREIYQAITSTEPLHADITRLFCEHVHDSRAGFKVASQHEPVKITNGYLRYRTVFPET